MAKQLKLSLIVICLVLSQASFAQKKEIQNASNYLDHNDLSDALTSIENAAKDDVTKDMAKTWMYRGKIMVAIAASDKDKALVVDPTSEAVKSFIKAYQLDEGKDLTSDIYMNLYNIFTTYYNQAATSLGKLEYGLSFKNFGRAAEVMKILPKLNPKFKISSDTVIYYRGYSAYKTDRFPAAKSAFQYLIDSTKYRTADLYFWQSNTLLALNDTVGALAVLDQGKVFFPNTMSLRTMKINLYLNTNRNKEAVDELNGTLDMLKKSNLPDSVVNFRSADLYNALGNAYDRTGDTAKANAAYKQSIVTKPDFFKPYFSLGAEYYNEGVLINKNMNKLGTSDADQKKYDVLKVDRDKTFIKAIPYLEKAHSINGKDIDTMRALKEIYTQTNQTDKATKIKAEMDALGGK